MQASATGTTASTSTGMAGVSSTDFKDAVLEGYKSKYLRNRRIMWLLIGASIIFAGLYTYLQYISVNKSFKEIPKDWKIENSVAADSSGKMVAVSVYSDSSNKDGYFTRRILISTDGGSSFEEKGGPWTGCNTVRSLSFAPDNASIVLMDNGAIFVKPADRDTFVIIPVKGFLPYKISYVFGTDTAYVYGFRQQQLLAFNYKIPENIVGYSLSDPDLISIAATDLPRRRMRGITYDGTYNGQSIDTAVYFTQQVKYSLADYRQQDRNTTAGNKSLSASADSVATMTTDSIPVKAKTKD